LAVSNDGAYDPVVSKRSSGGSRLAWTRFFADTNIYRLGLAGAQPGKPESLIASSFRDVFPQYSPDGKRIVFYSDRSGTHEIWICDASGSGCRQLTTLGAVTSGSPRWSPDGQQIVFDSNKGGLYQVYVVGADGGSPRRLTNPPSASFGGNWSRDGRWIYFGSDRSGGTEVWRMPAAGGTAEQVTHAGGSGPMISPDGKFLYYVKNDFGSGNGLWRAPIGGGEESRVLDSLFRYSYWVTEKGIYYAVSHSNVAGGEVRYLDFATNKTSILAATDETLDLGLTVSPDGLNLLYAQIDYQSANLMLVENFR
jgi:Tol biopolymer transport system component